MSFQYLLEAEAKGTSIALRFYDSRENRVTEIAGETYNPYFYLSHPLSERGQERVRSIHGKVETTKRRDMFTGRMRELSKVNIYNLDLFRKASQTFEEAWEDQIDYVQSYVYDHNLHFGAAYETTDGQLSLVKNASNEFGDNCSRAIEEQLAKDPQKGIQIRDWLELLGQDLPDVLPEQLELERGSLEEMHQAFLLARIANIPVTKAYRGRRVSDWLKSILHCYLRRHGYLIPTSKELRRGIETHRVPGALTVHPKAGVYFNTVVCDFESLYPSCIDSYNLSYETIDCTHRDCGTNRISECPEHWICTKRRGIFSVLIGALRDMRVHCFKPLSKNRRSVRWKRRAAILTRLLKLISVSGYGVTVRIHGLACPPLAECITAYGRWALRTTWSLAADNDLRPIYGDTDSLFMDSPDFSRVKWLIDTVKEKLRLDLAVEKHYSLCVLPTAKKAYFGILQDGKPDIKGLTVIKSNSPKLFQDVFRDCIKELANVTSLGEYESAKVRIINVVKRAIDNLKQRRVRLTDLVYSVKLYHDPTERSTRRLTSQPYQAAVQLLDQEEGVKRGDSVSFVKVRPFSYQGRTFTVKPVEQVRSLDEISVDDYTRNMMTALDQTFAPMGIDLEQKSEAKISDWFE